MFFVKSDLAVWGFTTAITFLVLLIFTVPVRAAEASSTVLSVQSDKVGSELVDFPVFVDLADMPASFWTEVKADGGDIRVYTIGSSEVPYELVSFSKQDQAGSLFFKAPVLSPTEDTQFRIDYGDNSKTAYLPGDTFGSENVWKDSYKAVLHLEEDPSGGTLFDSTRYGNNASTSGGMTISDSIEGAFAGRGVDMDGVDDDFTITHNAGLDWDHDDAFSIYGWVKTDRYIGLGGKYDGSGKGWQCKSDPVTAGQPYTPALYLRNSATHKITQKIDYDTGIENNEWHLIHCSYNGSGLASGINLYTDGNESVSYYTAADSLLGNSIRNLGNIHSGSSDSVIDGLLDELRLVEEALSPDWIAAEYINMSDPTTFYSIVEIDDSPTSIMEWLEALKEIVEGEDLKPNEENPLLKRIEDAIAANNNGDEDKLLGKLNGILGQFRGLKNSGRVSTETFNEVEKIVIAIKLIVYEGSDVPLITQIESPYPSWTETADWASDIYASDRASTSCGDTIAECGCAISSLSMIAQSYGIDQAVNGTSVNPGNMNEWLEANSGYTLDGSVKWGKALEYLSKRVGGKLMASLELLGHNSTDSSVIDSFLLHSGPAMAFNKLLGHFFVLTDKNEDGSYSVRDPWWYNTVTSDDDKDIANKIQDHNNNISKANLFGVTQGPKQLSRMIEVNLGSPAELTLRNSAGQVVGYVASTSEVVTQIEGGSYDQFDTIFTVAPSSTAHITKTLILLRPEDDIYTLEVTGTGSGDYNLSVLTIGDSGEPETTDLSGSTTPGHVDTFLVNVNGGLGEDLTALLWEIEVALESAPEDLVRYVDNKLRIIIAELEKGNTVAVDSLTAGLIMYLERSDSDTDTIIELLEELMAKP